MRPDGDMTDESSELRFVVLQLGARMHYAIPALLAQRGMLEQFYTDICGNKGAVKLLNYVWPQFARPKAVRRLLGRKLPDEVAGSLVTTCSVTALINSLPGKLRAPLHKLCKLASTEDKVIQQALKDNFLNANALYTNLINSDIELVRRAKEQKIQIVHEVLINPDVGYIMREEREKFPGIEAQDDLEETISGTERDREKWALSDLILVPSTFVRDSVIQMGGDEQHVREVPYGISEEWFAYDPHPQPGRILFVGSVGLRKGNHYLAEASRLLKQRRVDCQVNVVGPYDQRTIRRTEFQGPTYTGQIPRSEVLREFLRADVFVLPSLCEGMATAHLEAMACGVPVITTPNCGSVVRDGIDGFIVPIRNARMLAERIEQLVTDRALRQMMSENARQRARQFTWERYGDRLLSALETLRDDRRRPALK